MCNQETRIAQYRKLLWSTDILPVKDSFKNYSPAELAQMIRQLRDTMKHECGGGLECPLEAGLDRLSTQGKKFKVRKDAEYKLK